ncbi:helix-turn-helix transcriptional regulator [Bradyrhizobium sp. INPA01-394B]|uniref:Helix-turn-helix transcriptional regulator n=1 Tax=Bradyrhizobium campsiandrae TaxID=1729892 RepID=A0ABR7U6F2_9BRAD|nr:helix-turn-helix transcriptional regulator [Bradyrhizobium campsiandrae]MBC9979598.1 helix-turn-helix transcriptional regulator [Bradyrhizobium campsiandrae]
MAPPEGRLLAAIEAIYEAAPDPSQWPRALGAIADCFEDAGALLLWRRDDGSFGTLVSERLVEAQRDYEEGGWTRRDLAALRATERGYFFNGEPFTTRHLVSKEEIAGDPFFAQFRARHGLGPFGCVAVSPDPHVGVILSMQRHADQYDYSDDELETLGRIGRHIERSLRLSIRLLDAELAKIGLGEALARVGIGVFGLDSLGRVVFSNPAGERLAGDQLRLVHERLRIGTGDTRETIDEAIARTLRREPRELLDDPKPIFVHSSGAERRLVVYLLPVALRTSLAEQFLTHTRAIVLAIEQKRDEPADPAVVRDVLGLTLGEARIAAMVGSGLPPKEAADRLGITEETARTVLKRVFLKVGVSRQSELATLLAKLVLR